MFEIGSLIYSVDVESGHEPVDDSPDEAAVTWSSPSPGRQRRLRAVSLCSGRRRRRVVQPIATNTIVDDAKDLPVEQQHGHARHVERPHGRVDNEIGVVERAQRRRLRPVLGLRPALTKFGLTWSHLPSPYFIILSVILCEKHQLQVFLSVQP